MDAQDVHDTGEIVGQHVERHLGSNTRQRLHEEVSGTHARFDRAERVFDGLTPLAHLLGMFVEPLLHRFENMLMLPSGDPSLRAGRGPLDMANFFTERKWRHIHPAAAYGWYLGCGSFV